MSGDNPTTEYFKMRASMQDIPPSKDIATAHSTMARTRSSFVRLPSARGALGKTSSNYQIKEDVKILLREIKRDESKG